MKACQNCGGTEWVRCEDGTACGNCGLLPYVEPSAEEIAQSEREAADAGDPAMRKRSAERTQFLADVLVSIVEDGGYNGWRRIKAGTYQYDPPAEARAEIFCIGDGRPEEYSDHDVTLETVAQGIAKLQSGDIQVNSELLGWILAGNAKNDGGDIDAEAADIILQAALFGELVYG